MVKYPKTNAVAMRGRGLLLSVLLVLPLAAALPAASSERTVFTYELVDRAGSRQGPSFQDVCTMGERVGFALMADAGRVRFVVRDGLVPAGAYEPLDGIHYSACTFDGEGRFHGMYVNNARTEIRIATFDGSGWSDTLLDDTDDAILPAGATSNGTAYFMIHDDARPVFYIHDSQSGQWSLLDDSLPYRTRTVGLYFDVDSTGRIHLLWDLSASEPGYGPNRYRQYSVWEAGVWTTQDAPYGNQDGWAWAMSVGPDDKPYFAWADPQIRPHVYAPIGPGGAYIDERVMEGSMWNEAAGRDLTIRAGNDGSVHLHHFRTTLNFDSPMATHYFYSHRLPSGDWQTEPILPLVVQFGGAMELDPCDRPVIGVSHTRTPTTIQQNDIRTVGSTLLARPVDAHLGC